jgi:hypothetical protein
LEFLRDITPSLECLCAATLVGGLMVARFAAKVSGDLRAALRNLLQQFGTSLHLDLSECRRCGRVECGF